MYKILEIASILSTEHRLLFIQNSTYYCHSASYYQSDIMLQTWWSNKNSQEESILRNEFGPTRGEKRRKAGKKDKGRSDEGTYPILAGVAAGCRVQESFEGSLIGSLQRDRLRERNAKPREHGIYGAEMSKGTKAYAPSHRRG